MQLTLSLAISLATCGYCAAQEADIERLLAQKDPAIQEQIATLYEALTSYNVEPHENMRAFQERQKLMNSVADQGELVKQLVIFAATPTEDEGRPLIAYLILNSLRIPSHITIHVLAPYLDTNDNKLRAFVLDFFHGLDRADSGPFECVNYKDYLEYVRGKVSRNEEVSATFINYIYERSPGQALHVFRVATVDVGDYMRILRRSVEAAQQGRAPTAEERKEVRQVQAERQQEGQERREIVLAEHIISNAIWLHKREFKERFHAALPEAMEELKKLAKSKHWWARLYVVYIMRQNQVLLHDYTLRQLAEDENKLVSEVANWR
jgi:hypothetical protein